MKIQLLPLFSYKSYLFLLMLAVFLAVEKLPALAQFEDMAPPTQEIQSEKLKNKTEDLINWLERGEFPRVQQALHPDLQTDWTSERLEQRWQELLTQTGSLQRIVDAKVVQTINSDIVLVNLEFVNGTNEMLIDFNKQGQIVGIDFPQTQTIEEIAEKFVSDLASQDFAGARSYLHPFLKEEIFPAQIQQKWKQFLAQTGSFQRIVKTQTRRNSDVDDINLVLVTVEFAQVTDDIILAFDRDKKIINVDVIDLGSQ